MHTHTNHLALNHSPWRLLAVVTLLLALMAIALVGPAEAQVDGRGAHVYVSEVDSNTGSLDTREFIELYDGGTGSTSLSGLALVFFNGSDASDGSYFALDLTGTTDINGLYVMCANIGVPNCDLDVNGSGGNSDLLVNAQGAVAIYAAAASTFPNGTAPTTTNLVDALVYHNGTPDTALASALGQMSNTNENVNGMAASESIQLDPSSVPFSVSAPGNYYVGVPSPDMVNPPLAIVLSGAGVTAVASLPLGLLALALGAVTLLAWRRRAAFVRV